MEQEKILMGQKQLQRWHLMKMVEVGKITLKEAGERIGVSYRQAKRIGRAIRERGMKGLVHGNRGMAPKRRRRGPKHRKRRERMAQEGWMVLWDGSPHPWFGPEHPPCCLMAAIDDATGKLLAARFFPFEGSSGYLWLLTTLVNQYGIPMIIYQ